MSRRNLAEFGKAMAVSLGIQNRFRERCEAAPGEFDVGILEWLSKKVSEGGAPDNLFDTIIGDITNAYRAEESRIRNLKRKIASGYLKLISGDSKIIIAPTDGKKAIASASDTFTGYIDPDFVNYGVNVPCDLKKGTSVQVFEMIKDGTLSQIFGGFGENLDRLCLTQHQIISFVQNHSMWLREDGYGTFFLFKVKNEFFVARVDRYEGGLRVCVHRLSITYVWRAECRHRVVVPQL